MKHISFFILFFTFLSCSQDEKFTGSPEGVLDIENITGVISTQTNYALPGQQIDFTATLPDGFRSIYNDEVIVEATTRTIVGSVRKGYVTIPAGQNSATGKVDVGGGSGNLYDSSFTLNLSAIKLKNEILGKHFLLNSNVITINSGNTSVPDDNDNAISIQFNWLNFNKANFIELNTYRDKSAVVYFNRKAIQGQNQIKVNNVNYPVIFDTDLQTTVNNFVNAFGSQLNTLGINVTATDTALIFDFPTDSFIPVTVSSTHPPANPLFLRGKVSSSINYSPPGSTQKDFTIYKSQKLRVDGNYTDESGNSAFNPGTYMFRLGVTSANYLEINPTPELKYRIIVKYPDSKVEVFNGTLNNLGVTPVSGFINVLKVVKTGNGDNANFVVTKID